MRSVVVTGFPFHGASFCRLLNRYADDTRAFFYPNSRSMLLRAVLHADVADASITFGGPRPHGLILKVCNARSRPAIVLWAGSDVTSIARAPQELERLRLDNVIHWVCSHRLIAELAQLGIDARYVPVAHAPIPSTLTPLPSKFTVLTYLPEPRRDFYGQADVWSAARALPDVTFLVVGRGEPEPAAPSNVCYLGEVKDMEARIDASSVLLRLTPHDSLPHGIVEALARGRHVVWTYPFPGVTQVLSRSESIAVLTEMRDAHCRGALALNETGARYIAGVHNPPIIAAGVVAAIDESLEFTRRARRQRTSSRRIVISGQEMLAGRVAENCKRHPAIVTGSILNASTKANTLISALELFTSDTWYRIGVPTAPPVFSLAARLSNKPQVIHWLGQDVQALAASPKLLHRFRSSRYRHLAQDDAVARRLHLLGISTLVVPLAALPLFQGIRPLPKTFTLLLYIPAGAAPFAGRVQCEELMQALRAEPIHCVIVGGGDVSIPSGVSAESVGWRHDLTGIYESSTALVRLNPRESVSTMVLETLLHGRYVFWSHTAPYVTRVTARDDLERAVRALLRRHVEGSLKPQFDAAALMSSRYAPDRCLQLLAKACS